MPKDTIFGNYVDYGKTFKNNDQFLAMQGLLKQQAAGQDPLIAQQRQLANANITNTSNRALQNEKERLAQSGLKMAGSAVNQDIYATEENAKAGVELGFAEQQQRLKNAAIAQLLGLEKDALGFDMQSKQFNTSLDKAQQDQFNWRDQFQLQKDQYAEENSFGWQDLASLGIGAAGLLMAPATGGGSVAVSSMLRA